MISDQQLESLRSFNEKVEKLRRSQFLKSESFTLQFTWEQGQPFAHEWAGPDETAIDAFVLTHRLFFQDKDCISVRQVAEIYEAVSVDQRQRFADIRRQLNDYLDGTAGFAVNDKPVSWRDILQVVLYGELAHVDQDKRAKLDLWRRMDASAAYVLFLFVNVLYDTFMAINHIAVINAEIIGIPMSTGPG